LHYRISSQPQDGTCKWEYVYCTSRASVVSPAFCPALNGTVYVSRGCISSACSHWQFGGQYSSWADEDASEYCARTQQGRAQTSQPPASIFRAYPGPVPRLAFARARTPANFGVVHHSGVRFLRHLSSGRRLYLRYYLPNNDFLCPALCPRLYPAAWF